MISKIVIKLAFALTFLYAFQTFGQEKIYSGNPDTSFETARKLVFDQHRKQGQDTLSFILTKYPDYHDIRSLLASTYSWDGDYKKARTEFAYILERDSKTKSIWIAAIKNELWGDFPFIALEMTKNALIIFPEDAEILYLKASAEENIANPLEALSTIQSLLDKNPKDQKAKEYKINLNKILRKNTIGINSEVDFYSSVFDPMQFHTLKYSRQTKYGSIIGKLNFSRRFNQNGKQFEIDMYPKISKGFYAYLNIGFANTFLFPDLKYSAELFKSLPKSFEVSLGFRTLKYSSITTIYTGSIGWYNGNSYWSFRPYFTPGDNGISKSGTLTYRKYRSDADNYFGIAIGMGFSPEINQFNFNGNELKIVNLKSQKINLGYYFSTSNKQNAFGAQFGIAHQEIVFDQGNFFWIYSFTLSWDLKLK